MRLELGRFYFNCAVILAGPDTTTRLVIREHFGANALEQLECHDGSGKGEQRRDDDDTEEGRELLAVAGEERREAALHSATISRNRA